MTAPQPSAEKVTALVAAAGLSIAVDRNEDTAVRRPGNPQEIRVPVVGATSGFMNASQAELQPNTSVWLLDTPQNVALLGTSAAAELSIPVSIDPTGYQIQIGDTLYQVIGFIDSGRIDQRASAVIPYQKAVEAMHGDATAQVLVRTSPGARRERRSPWRTSGPRTSTPGQCYTALPSEGSLASWPRPTRRGTSPESAPHSPYAATDIAVE